MTWKTWERNVCLTEKGRRKLQHRGRGSDGNGSRTRRGNAKPGRKHGGCVFVKVLAFPPARAAPYGMGRRSVEGIMGAKMGDTAVSCGTFPWGHYTSQLSCCGKTLEII